MLFLICITLRVFYLTRPNLSITQRLKTLINFQKLMIYQYVVMTFNNPDIEWFKRKEEVGHNCFIIYVCNIVYG